MIATSISGFFCDDIREEVSGKRSLIGCYGDYMLVPSLPAVLPQLCVVVVLQASGEEDLSGMRIVVLKNDDALMEGTINDVERYAGPEDLRTVMQKAVINFVLSPLQLDSECHLRVRGYIGDRELRGLALTVRRASEDVGLAVGGGN